MRYESILWTSFCSGAYAFLHRRGLEGICESGSAGMGLYSSILQYLHPYENHTPAGMVASILFYTAREYDCDFH